MLRSPAEVETAAPFTDLFPVRAADVEAIAADIREHGFRSDRALVLWRDAFGDRGRNVLVDGHRRLAAALEVGVDSVPVVTRRYPDLDAAVEAAVTEQVRRRNLTGDQRASFVLDALPTLDGDHGGRGARNDLHGRTAKEVAEMLGVSTSTVERARVLLASGRADLVARVQAGEIGLEAAVRILRNGHHPPRRSYRGGDRYVAGWHAGFEAGRKAAQREQRAEEKVELDFDFLTDVVALCHPDRHPPERGDVANRVTARLIELRKNAKRTAARARQQPEPEPPRQDPEADPDPSRTTEVQRLEVVRG